MTCGKNVPAKIAIDIIKHAFLKFKSNKHLIDIYIKRNSISEANFHSFLRFAKNQLIKAIFLATGKKRLFFVWR